MANDGIEALHYDIRRQARRAELEMKPKTWKRNMYAIGLICLVLTAAAIGGYVYWRLNYVRTVRASVYGALYELSFDIDAYLKSLPVQVGDSVRKGQELARLDDTQAQEMLRAAEELEAMRQIALNQAKARGKMLENEIAAEIELAQAGVDAAAARLESAQAEIAAKEARIVEEIHAAEAQRQEADAHLELVKKGERSEIIEAARERLEAARSLAELREYEVEQAQLLYEQGLVSQYDLKGKETELARQSNAVRQAELELERYVAGATEEELEIANQALEARKASVQLARASQEETKSMLLGLKVRQAELREAQAALRQAEARRDEIRLAEENIQSAEAELRRAQADVNARRAALDALALRSPVDGVISRTFVHEGELCRKAAPVIQLFDNSEGRWFEGFVRETDSHLIREGQTATVEIVLGSRNKVKAKVSAISMGTNSIDPEKTSGSAGGAAVSELVWLKLTPIEPLDWPLPGMSARATIRVR